MFYADTLGLTHVAERVKAIEASGGGAYWRPSSLLLELAANGRTFADWDRERVTR
jgi:hypothetical protein